MKILLLLAALLFVSPAKAECQQPFDTFVSEATKDITVNVRPITAPEQASLFAKIGPPPVTEPYELDVAKSDTSGVVVIVQDNCIVGKVGPLPILILNNALGESGA